MIKSLLPLSISAVLLPSFGCQLAVADRATAGGSSCVEASGSVVTQTRAVGYFEALELHGSADLTLRVGPHPRVVVEADEVVVSDLQTQVDDGRLVIQPHACVWGRSRPTVTVTAPHLDELIVAGSGDVRGELLATGELGIDVYGSGDVTVSASATAIVGTIRGSGSLRLAGTADALDLSVFGSGDIDSVGIRSRTASATIHGSGDIRLHASHALAATIHGSGDIAYAGSPRTLARTIRGSGDISAL